MKVEFVNKDSKKNLRYIAVNSLITIFITMNYFFLSEVFGSISTPYFYTNKFEIIFSPTLFLFIFFSILAGPVQALVSGFIGEFFYQLAFYESLSLYWCVIVGILGLINGFYKYKPLKYQNLKTIWYTFLILVISSLLFTIWNLVFHIFLNLGGYSMEEILINFGLKSLIQSLISLFFLIPFSLFIYDKYLAKRERHIYNLFLTHHTVDASDHTFRFQFGKTYIYFCSRCSGMIIGLIISLFFTHLVEMIFNSELNSLTAFVLIIILPIPGLIDWGTQRLLLRTSSTSSRIFTGFVIGVAMHLISFTKDYYFFTLIIITIYFSILFIIIYYGQKRLLKQLNEELTPQPPEIDKEE